MNIRLFFRLWWLVLRGGELPPMAKKTKHIGYIGVLRDVNGDYSTCMSIRPTRLEAEKELAIAYASILKQGIKGVVASGTAKIEWEEER